MKELTKIFNNIEIPVEVEDEENIWFDVSNIIKENKVNFTEWKNGKRILKLISNYEKSNNIKRHLIDDKIHGKNFIHRKMFISFARFVSIEFEMKAVDTPPLKRGGFLFHSKHI